MKFGYFLFLMCFVAFVSLAEAHQGTRHVKYQQPGDDGVLLSLHVIGDHLYSRTETEEGYTVVFNGGDRTYYYAVLNEDGSEFVASGVKAGEPVPQNLPRKLKITSESRNKKALEHLDEDRQKERKARWREKVKASKEKRMKKLKEMGGRKLKKEEGDVKAQQEEGAQADVSSTSITPQLGAAEFNSVSADVETKKGLTILVQFPDDPNTADDDPVVFPSTREKIIRYCNEEGYSDDGNTGSVRDYFYDQSNGLLDYSMSVTQVITMPQPRDYYNYSDYPTNGTLHPSGTSGRLLMADSAEILNNENYDFSDLSFDDNGNVLATNIFFAGDTSGVWPLGLWPHQWATAYAARPEITVNGETRYLYLYQVTNLSSAAATIGTFIHESGHLVLDYPDLYDYGGESSGIGTHGIMASGNFANQGKTPTPINLYFKDILGWADVVDIEASDYVKASLPATGNVGYRITNPDDSDEFFIVENRSYDNGATGGDKWAGSAPDEGIIIWHVDDAVSGNDDEQRTESQHYQVSLEQQDGLFELESGGSADGQDLYDSNSSVFNDESLPNANWWDGSPSGIVVDVESDAAAMMNVTFGLSLDLAVTYPNGGEHLIEDGEVHIKWNNDGTGSVNIELLKGGALIDSLASNESNDGSYLWTVANSYEKADDYRIRVTVVDDNSNTIEMDESDEDFSILSEQFVAGGTLPSGWGQSALADASWSVANDHTSEGSYSLKSDLIDHNEIAQIEYQVTTEEGVITFDAKVSSETNYDFLEFYIDGVEQDLDVSSGRYTGVSGDSGWVSYSFVVSAGAHTLIWSYEKDGSVSSLDDRSWIDNVIIPEVQLTGIALWKESNFDDGYALADLEDLADPDGDGFSNLLEYAFGTNPNDPQSLNSLELVREGTDLSIIYNQNMEASDLVFVYQHQSNLDSESWLIATVTEEVINTEGSMQTMKATMRVEESETRHFMRVKVGFVDEE